MVFATGGLQQLVGSTANASGYRITGPIKLTGWQWSSTPGVEKGEGWALDFGDGGRASVVAGDSGLNRALCVHEPPKKERPYAIRREGLPALEFDAKPVIGPPRA